MFAETLASSIAMSASNQISAAVFSAFVKCPTKAHLLAIGEPDLRSKSTC
jgi:hypothetical protein